MRVDLLCTDKRHPVFPVLKGWIAEKVTDNDLRLISELGDLKRGDILFLISCGQFIDRGLRNQYSEVLVLHASDLPRGRGWSPHIWDIVNGKDEIVLSLISAEDAIDTGAIWAQTTIKIPPDALSDEINSLLFCAEIELIEKGIRLVSGGHSPKAQSDIEPSYHRRRTPKDSKIDAHLSIAEQFNKIRVADPKRFPAYFELHGETFELRISKREK